VAHVSDWAAPTFEPALVGVEQDDRTVIRLVDAHDTALADDGVWPIKPELGTLPFGDETDRLRNRGFTDWQSLYPARQLHVISASLEAADAVAAGRPEMKLALTTAVIGTAELPGYLSRWDPRYLKPYEAVANHRFQPTLLPVEMNLWGAGRQGRSLNRRLEALYRASAWMEAEVGTRNVRVSWDRRSVEPADVTVVMGSSDRVPVDDETFDLILTDPPYHDDVQYGELSEIFRCWLDGPGAQRKTTGDVSVGRRGCSTGDYRERLRRLFVESRRTLRSDGRMIISFANRDPDAWIALIGALHDAGFSAAGYTWVHSENESDHSKRTVRAATLDMLVDLVPGPVDTHYAPAATPGTDQERFLATAGKWVGLIGQLPDGWEEQVTADLASEPYVAA
jgi:adenine-specific DNA methylase